MDRRTFFAGSVASAFVLHEACTPLSSRVTVDGGRALRFRPVQASADDVLSLPDGYRYDVVVSYGDLIGRAADGDAPSLGYNNDFTAYIPIDARAGGRSSDRGLLFVNHEYNDRLLQHGVVDPRVTTREQVQLEMSTVGCSVLEVARGADGWRVLPESRFGQRVSALGPMIDLSGPARGSAAAQGRLRARGTLSNCSGGVTPWHTVTTCEENYQYAYGYGAPPFEGANGWHRYFSGTPTDYGWVVEIDPFGELPSRKRTALGRFAHENCAFAMTDDGRLVVYSADDHTDRCVYKFVSSWKLTGDRRLDWEHALDEGVLYTADFLDCTWQRLRFDDDPALWRSRGFADQGDILVRARDAALAAGGTPMDRPECVVVHPHTREVFIAFTKNLAHGNPFGRIAWLREQDRAAEAESFSHGVLAVGGAGAESFACPDNLMLDSAGGMWMATDISGGDLLQGAHDRRGNNAMFFVETAGENRGASYRFANGPRDSEFTGLSTTPDESTLFVSVQHPGEMSASLDQLSSHWPRGRGQRPLPSVVAITRDDGARVVG